MKRVLLFATLLSMVTMHAQDDGQKKKKLTIEKGTWNLGGNFSFGFNEGNSDSADSSLEDSSTFVSISPNMGYFIGSNIEIGLGIGYSFRKTDSQFTEDAQTIDMATNMHSFSIYPYARKYFGINKNFAFYLQGEGSYSRSKNEQEIMNNGNQNFDSSSDSFFVGIRPGLTFFVSNSFAFETSLGSLGYSTSSFENTRDNVSDGNTDSFNLNLSSSDLFFGLSYYF